MKALAALGLLCGLVVVALYLNLQHYANSGCPNGAGFLPAGYVAG